MLSKHDRVVLDTMLPSRTDPKLPLGLFDTGFETLYASFVRDAARPFRVGFRVALWTATWIAPLLIRRFPPLSRHDRPTRERALIALAGSDFSPFRQLVAVLKIVASLGFGADPRVRHIIGYPGSARDEAVRR
jgi:hypothetical protein